MGRRDEWQMPSEEELLKRLDLASKSGSVQATRLLLEELRRDDGDEASDFDALDSGNVSPIRQYGA
jgi:hypothetical protein